MAHVLALYDGTNTITLTTGYYILTDYVPRSAGESSPTVTESASVRVTAASLANLQTAIHALETFFEVARIRQSRLGIDTCYVYSTTDTADSGATWRSEVVDGRVILGDDAWRHWASVGVDVVLTWTRRNYWEYSDSLVELALDNTSAGAKATGGITIYLHDDSTTGHDNYVEIAGSDVDGSLPSPLYITLSDNVNGLIYRNLYIASDNFYEATSAMIVLEGESDQGAFTNTVDANSSNGNYATVIWPTNTAHDDLVNSSSTLLIYWNIPDALMNNTNGEVVWWNVMARFPTKPAASIYGKFRVVTPEPNMAISTTNVLWEGPEFLMDTTAYLQHLGAVPIPPTNTLAMPATLLFTVRAAASGSLLWDYAQLVGPDGFRHFEILASVFDSGDTITVDGVLQRYYTYDLSATVGTPMIDHGGSGDLVAIPGRNQVLRFFLDESTSATIDRTLTVRCYHRPRRLTL